MEVPKTKMSFIVLNALFGSFLLGWVFSTTTTFPEITILLVVFSIFLTFSSLAYIRIHPSEGTFLIRNILAFVLLLMTLFLQLS